MLFKEYEAKDHLGNIVATYTDLKKANFAANQDPQQPWSLDLRSVSNYYPFGMLEPGRHWEAANYSHRFGYNGMEKDDDIKGLGNSYDYGARFYDPRVGRFLSIDPDNNKLAGWTNYQYCRDNPIYRIDADGRFDAALHQKWFEDALNNTTIKISNNHNLKVKTEVISNLAKKAKTTDYIYSKDSRYHFDGFKGLVAIKSNWNFLNKEIRNIFAKDDRDEKKYVVYGRIAHVRADFYSHSNYVELYSQYFKANNPSNTRCNINDIPTFNQMMTDNKFAGFKKFLEENPNSLYTGTYSPGVGFGMFTEQDKGNDYSHWLINKDNATSPEGKKHEPVYGGSTLFQAAENVAKRDLQELVKQGVQSGELPTEPVPSK